MAQDQNDKQTIDAFPRRRGRPRKYASDAERVRAWRERQKLGSVSSNTGSRRKEISLPPDHALALEVIAKRRGISQGDLVAQLMDEAGLMKDWRDPC